MAEPDLSVTQLQSAFPTNAPGAAGAASSSATETPYGATKANPLGVEAPAIRARETANTALRASTTEEGENQLNRAVMGQEQANAEANLPAADLAEMHAFHDTYKQHMQAELDHARTLQERIERESRPHDYWADKGMFNKVLAHIVSGLAGFGAGKYTDLVKDMADADHAKQMAQVNNLLKAAETQGASIDRLRQLQQDAQEQMGLVQSLKYKSIAAEYKKQAALATTVEAKTAALKAAAYFDKLHAEEGLKYQMTRRVKASKSATHAMKPAAPARQD